MITENGFRYLTYKSSSISNSILNILLIPFFSLANVPFGIFTHPRTSLGLVIKLLLPLELEFENLWNSADYRLGPAQILHVSGLKIHSPFIGSMHVTSDTCGTTRPSTRPWLSTVTWMRVVCIPSIILALKFIQTRLRRRTLCL
ncbi:hypothetical protein BDZ91DRAFT_98202 [Kalaharituber pfeilii]|nr:hypothetical protein BDZ91DRAFT_98202 [Kalaharituber pfeilii]